MPGVALSRRKAALGAHRRDVVELRHFDALDDRALLGELLQRTLERCCDNRIEIVHRHGGRYSKAHALDRARRELKFRFAGQHSIHRRAAGDRACERADAVERKGQRHGAIERHAALRRLVADDAVEGCRNAAGTAGVGTQRRMRHGIEHGNGGAGGRATRHMADLALPRAFGRAVMRIGADARIGEFDHVGAADHHEAGAAQTRDGGRVGIGRRGIVQRARTGAGHLTLDVEQVLDGDRNAGEARRRGIGLAQRVHGIGGGQCRILVDMDEGALALAVRIGDFGQTGFDQFARGGAAGGEVGGQAGEGRCGLVEVVAHGRGILCVLPDPQVVTAPGRYRRKCPRFPDRAARS